MCGCMWINDLIIRTQYIDASRGKLGLVSEVLYGSGHAWCMLREWRVAGIGCW
jgi:hypothetical protein